MLNLTRLLTWTFALGLGTFALLAQPSWVKLAVKACNELQDNKGEWDKELHYLCSLPHEVKQNIPEVYWLNRPTYKAWVKTLPTTPAPHNLELSVEESQQWINQQIQHPQACHFFSPISPSVQKGWVDSSRDRTRVVTNAQTLLDECRSLAKEMKRTGALPCKTIEFAGHSTQAVGIDAVFGLAFRGEKKHYFPSKPAIEAIGECLREISSNDAVIVFSTCGGEEADPEAPNSRTFHYWPGKESAQKELAILFERPILSGIGYVQGAPDGSVYCEAGWHHSSVN